MQTKLGVSGGYHGAGDNPFILLVPCGMTYVRYKHALLGQSHIWEVWYKTQKIQLLFCTDIP